MKGGPRSRRVLGAWLVPSGGVHVTIGEPIDLSDFLGRPITRALLQAVTEKTMERLSELGG